MLSFLFIFISVGRIRSINHALWPLKIWRSEQECEKGRDGTVITMTETKAVKTSGGAQPGPQ